jgi:hypothetical protein
MASVTFRERLDNWKEGVLGDLRKRWWWVLIASPILAFVTLLVEDRVVGAANKYIDAHISVASISGYAPYPVRFVVLGLCFAAALLLVLVCHAYIETRGGSRPAIDAEVYRAVVAGKGVTADMTREIYKLIGELDKFAIDVDVLVEMYAVNATNTKQFIRDIEGTVEVDGKTLPLIRQNDFDACKFGDTPYEFCLNKSQSDNRFDRSGLESLLPFFQSSNSIALEAREPHEGWIHFIVKEVDPQKLNDNRSYKFTIVDSLRREHPILKANRTKRLGEVTVRAKPGF